MAERQHCFYERSGLLEMLQLCLQDNNHKSLMIVGSSREGFEEALLRLLDSACSWDGTEQADSQAKPAVGTYLRRLVEASTSLRSIASCRSLQMAFCSDVAHLRALFAKLTLTSKLARAESSASGSSGYTRVVIINMLRLHVSTSSWSAQGINRCLAAAVSLADAMDCQLLVAEDPILPLPELEADLPSSPRHATEPEDSSHDLLLTAKASMFDAEVGIVDTRTRTFGAGSRGWVGRTVQVRTILRRWLVLDPSGST